MKKKAFKQLLSSIDEARILKARELVLRLAKKCVDYPDYYPQMLKSAIALKNLESKHDKG